jgi:hypothetical protein
MALMIEDGYEGRPCCEEKKNVPASEERRRQQGVDERCSRTSSRRKSAKSITELDRQEV